MADKKLSVKLSAAKSELLKHYADTFKKQCKENSIHWACKRTDGARAIHPTIPFIGRNYLSAKSKVLLYASAENLAYLQHKTKERKALDNDAIARDRCRYFFEIYKKEEPERPFPFVHITPVNNGALLVITAYLLKKSGISYKEPFELIEDIAVANFGKFSIQTGKKANKDYGNSTNKDDKKKLDISFEYVEADIKTLKPDILIMPDKIYKGYKKEFENFNVTVFPIYQITPTTINAALGKYKNKYKSTKDVKGLRQWHEDIAKYNGGTGGRGVIRGKTLDNFKAIYPYLDEIYEKYRTGKK